MSVVGPPFRWFGAAAGKQPLSCPDTWPGRHRVHCDPIIRHYPSLPRVARRVPNYEGPISGPSPKCEEIAKTRSSGPSTIPCQVWPRAGRAAPDCQSHRVAMRREIGIGVASNILIPWRGWDSASRFSNSNRTGHGRRSAPKGRIPSPSATHFRTRIRPFSRERLRRSDSNPDADAIFLAKPLQLYLYWRDFLRSEKQGTD
jgi:hypothetical protein